MAEPLWFWQRIVSPHMAGLATALAATGREVTYIAEEEMSAERAAQGWKSPPLGNVNLRFATTVDAVRKAVSDAPSDSIHICQGLRGNGLVRVAQNSLAARGLKQWVIMETVEERGWLSSQIKRLEYARLIRIRRKWTEGILAIGHTTPDWLIRNGMPAKRIFPFAYFLPDTASQERPTVLPRAPFRFLFVGRLVELKRVDLIIDALATLKNMAFELRIIGAGPLEVSLQARAREKLPGRVHWFGPRRIEEIPALMAEADCLILPSRHDGWGAVVSEALMAGTPAICSDACGVAGAVRASGCGGVFPTGNVEALAHLLHDAMAQDPQTPERRATLAAWARRLGATAGATYLGAILRHTKLGGERPWAPWQDMAIKLGDSTKS